MATWSLDFGNVRFRILGLCYDRISSQLCLEGVRSLMESGREILTLALVGTCLLNSNTDAGKSEADGAHADRPVFEAFQLVVVAHGLQLAVVAHDDLRHVDVVTGCGGRVGEVELVLEGKVIVAVDEIEQFVGHLARDGGFDRI